MNIILTGMRGTGKTTLGEQIANELKWEWIDIDHRFEEIMKMPIRQFVETNGWEAFRKKEKEITLQLATTTRTVISTGGGTLMDPETATTLKKTGVIVLLTCDMKTLRNYLEKSHARPSLTTNTSALDELDTIWSQRKEQYHALADLIHDTSTWPSHHLLLDKLRERPMLNL